MNKQNPSPIGNGEEESSTTQGVDKSRRRLTAAGLATPVLLSLANKPAWATSSTCTISGKLSGNISPGAATSGCHKTLPYGCKPGTWLGTNINSWPGGTTTKNSKYNTHPCFSPRQCQTRNGRTWLTTPTILQVMQACQGGSTFVRPFPGGTDNVLYDDSYHAICGFLNASSSNFAYPFTVEQVDTAYATKNMAAIKSFHNVIETPNLAQAWLIANGFH